MLLAKYPDPVCLLSHPTSICHLLQSVDVTMYGWLSRVYDVEVTVPKEEVYSKNFLTCFLFFAINAQDSMSAQDFMSAYHLIGTE